MMLQPTEPPARVSVSNLLKWRLISLELKIIRYCVARIMEKFINIRTEIPPK